jgi:hypothetical protein
MAENRFSVAPPNILQALMIGAQGYEGAQKRTKEADLMAGRQEAVQVLQSGGDTRGALARLIGVGDIQGANAIANYAENQANRGFREQQAQRSQQNADRSFGLQQQQLGLAQRQADLAAKGVDIKEVDDPANPGTKILVRVERSTGKSERLPIGGTEAQPVNPYAPTGKLTEGEAKDRAYLNRMVPSHQIITGLEKINEGTGGFIGGVAASNPLIRDTAAFNLASSKDRQKVLQAQRDFTNAILRRESGAVISASEFDNAQRQYFPMPGDGPEVIEQKRQNRMLAIEGMMQGAGRGYKPPADYVGTKGPAQPGTQTAEKKRLKFNPATGDFE